MEISDEDRNAFHNQADRISGELSATEANREDGDRSVTSVFFDLDENDEAVMVTVKVLPRHRFLVKTPDRRVRTTRRDEAIEAARNALP